MEERVLKLKQEMKEKEKELRFLKDQELAKLKQQCHLLTCLNELRCKQIAKCEKKFDAFVLDLGQVNEELTLIYQNGLKESFSGLSKNHQDVLDKMAIELRCGVCSELMVFATSLNCMHTFCQYCVSKWKSESPSAGCPICREPTHFEKRNFLVDNMITLIVSSLYSEEEQYTRRKFEKEHQELQRILLCDGLRTPEYNNPFYRITDRGLVLGEMQIEELPIVQGQPSQSCNFMIDQSRLDPFDSSTCCVIFRERLDNRRRIHYTRLLANIGRRRLLSRTIFQSIPPCSPESGRPPVLNISTYSTGVSTPRIGETALALSLLYIALTLFLYYTLYYLHVL